MTGLNDNYRRRILTSLQYADKLLTESLHALAPGAQPLFSSYAPDLTPAEARCVEGYTRKIREQMARLLENCGIERSVPSMPSSGKIRTGLTSVDLTLEDMYPEKMRGYGKMDAGAARELAWHLQEIRWLISLLLNFLSAARSARDETPSQPGAGPEIAASLQRLARIIESYGLVEFLPVLEEIVGRTRSFAFEIAVFGRNGCGKSSLINRLLGAELLPAGAASPDAVPLRIAAGPQPGLRVSFVDRNEDLPLEQLHTYASVRENPANSRRIVAMEVRADARRLQDAFVFVEMPGLGWSLPGDGKCAEAFLPGSDFALIMVEASAGIGDGELDLMRALAAADVPWSVLLARCDLLPPQVLERAREQVRDAVARIQAAVPEVIAVSTSPSWKPAAGAWFDEMFLPRLEQSRSARIASITEDQRALAASLLAALQEGLQPASAGSAPKHEAEEVLRRMDECLDSFQAHWDREVDRLAAWSPEILEHAAAGLAGASAGADQIGSIAQDFLAATLTRAAAERFLPFLREFRDLTARIGADLKQLQAGPHAAALIPRQMPRLSGLPMPALSLLAGVNVQWPGAAARRDPAARQRYFRKELEEKGAAQLRQMIEELQPRLRRWFVATMSALKDSMRLQTARLRYRSPASDSVSPGEELAADIDFLRTFVS
jgi:hypothetical protein